MARFHEMDAAGGLHMLSPTRYYPFGPVVVFAGVPFREHGEAPQGSLVLEARAFLFRRVFRSAPPAVRSNGGGVRSNLHKVQKQLTGETERVFGTRHKEKTILVLRRPVALSWVLFCGVAYYIEEGDRLLLWHRRQQQGRPDNANTCRLCFVFVCTH